MIAARRLRFSGAVALLALAGGVSYPGCRRAEAPPQEAPSSAATAARSDAGAIPESMSAAPAPASRGEAPKGLAHAEPSAGPNQPGGLSRAAPTSGAAAGAPAEGTVPTATYDPTISPTAVARTLADEGTPAAYLEIVRLINNLPDGPERRAALVAATKLDNPATAALLFETVRVSGDPELVQSAQISLGSMTNEGVVWLTVALFRGTEDVAQQERLLGVLRHGRQPVFVAPLISVADQSSDDPTDPLAVAALDTLGMLGTTESIGYLVDRLNSAARSGQETAALAAALGRVVAPSALSTLTGIAAGQSPSAQMEARVAAARALGHYPLSDVEDALNSILQNESDPRLINAAQEAMDLAAGRVPADFTGTP